MKNFTNNFKQFTSRLSARWLIMALMMLVGTSSAWGWGFKYDDGGNWNTCSSSSFDQTTFYTNPTGSSTTSVYIRMHTGLVKTGFNITQNDGCDGQKLYVNLSGVASTSSNTIVRASARWVNNKGIYSEYTIVIPEGKIYIKPTNGDAVLMTKSTYTYTAELTLSDAKTFDLYADDPGNSTIENQDGMPSAGKPTSVRLNYTGLTSPYQYVKVTYNLKTNQITFEEEDAPCTPPDAPTLTNPAAQCGGSITLPESANELNLKWYDAQIGGNVVSNTEITATGTYWAAAVTECESTDRTAYTITINPVPSFTVDPTNLSLCKGSTSVTDLTELSHVVVENGDPVWYDAETAGNVVTTGADLENGGTYWVAAENNETGCVNTERKSFTLKIYDLPKYPDLTKTSAVVCQADETVNLNTLAGVNDVIWYQGEDEVQKPDEISIDEEGIFTYTAKAVNVNGCQSATGVDFKLTVNPLPTINIGEDVTAVLYEDVELTADTDGTSISWEITEGDGSLSSTTGNSVTLTSSSVGTVTVTATATSADDCTSAVTKTVTFDEEDCTQPEDEKTIEIWCRMSDNSNGSSIKCYGFGAGNFFGSYPGSTANNGTGTYESKTYQKWIYTFDSKKSGLKVIFNTQGDTDKTVDISVGSSGKRYYYWYNKSNKTYGLDDSETIYTPAPITAPAAKTISVSTTEGEGNIIFSGQVVKTGCDATNEYGFQYSSDEQTWTTVKVGVNAAAGTAISNNTVTGLDGTYYVRAYITNDNSTQYGAIKEITVSTKKYPITTVILTHVRNQAGDSYSDQELENLTYCVGDIVWFKLEQDGSNFQEYEWISCPGTELKGMYTGGMFQFKITNSGNVGIRLRNDANVDGEGNPTWAESNLLEFNTHPEPTAPTISFAKATICSNDNKGATLTLGATVSGQAYELWKYENDDDTEGSKVANVATLNCTENNQELQFTGIKTAGKYFVKTYYTAFCNTVTANSSYATLTVVNAKDVSISITPATATTTPWMPVKLTISATDDYTLEVPEGVEFSQNGDICSVKIPLPDGATGGEEQYENVSFPKDAITSYTVTANLVSIGGENNPCAVPATATITLTPYVEECTIGH